MLRRNIDIVNIILSVILGISKFIIRFIAVPNENIFWHSLKNKTRNKRKQKIVEAKVEGKRMFEKVSS